MSAISCQKIISYKGIKIKVSKLSFDTLFILCSVEVAWSLDFLHSIQFGEKISNTSTKLMCSDFWWFLMNVISKYLFLEQFCQFSERVLKFFSKAGDSIHSFSSCTHIGALKTEWKCIFSWKSAYLYTSNVQRTQSTNLYFPPSQKKVAAHIMFCCMWLMSKNKTFCQQIDDLKTNINIREAMEK